MKLNRLIYCLILLVVFFQTHGQGIANFSSDLPIFVINSDGVDIPNYFKINASLKIISNENGAPNYYSDVASDYNGNIGIEIRGSSSAWYPQTPYGIETRTSDGENLNVSLLGLPKENDWILLSNYNDKSLMRNILGYQLFESLGHYAPRAKYVDVIVNGTYEGIYIFTEKIKRDKGRVDIAKLKPEDENGEDLTGGYIFKIDYFGFQSSWESPFHPIGYPEYDIHFVFHDPNFEELTPIQESYLESYVTDFEEALYSDDFKSVSNGYPNFIDIRSFIDYFIVSEISRNNDGFKKSRYFHKDKNDKIVAGPVWDFDWAWKNINECSIFKATDGSGWSYKINDCRPDVNSPGWMIRLFQDEAFADAVNCRYTELRQDILSNESIFNRIDSLYEVTRNAQVKHFQKWEILGINVGAPEVDSQPSTYLGEVQKLREWISLRLKWLDNNMLGSCDSTFVANNSLTKLEIYPNPAQNEVIIEVDGDAVEIQIYNIHSQAVFQKTKNLSSINRISLTGLINGVYIVQVVNEQGEKLSQKLIIH